MQLRAVASFVGILIAAAPASSAVLCARRSGTLRFRRNCRPNETRVDPVVDRVCAPDAVKVGGLCADKYEASLWSIPAGAAALLDKVRHGEATLQDLNDGGATQLNAAAFNGCTGPQLPASFPPNGNWTEPVYAVSVPGVQPSACMTWFQAVQACAVSGKHLLTNEEWQRAAAGTPDPGADGSVGICTIFSEPEKTGSHPACVSTWGAYDMAGNVYEWVADWGDRAQTCGTWPADYGDDVSCYGGGSVSPLPAALIRGGYFGLSGGPNAGIFDVYARNLPSFAVEGIGFRCGR